MPFPYYKPRFDFNPDLSNYVLQASSAATVAHDLALAFQRDIDGKISAALIAMGWTPPLDWPKSDIQT